MVWQEDSVDWDSIDQALSLWRKRWDFDGYALMCKTCGGRQLPALSQKPFPHKGLCVSYSHEFDFPWREIVGVMAKANVQNRT